MGGGILYYGQIFGGIFLIITGIMHNYGILKLRNYTGDKSFSILTIMLGVGLVAGTFFYDLGANNLYHHPDWFKITKSQSRYGADSSVVAN